MLQCKTTLKEQIAIKLRELILERHLEPGDKLLSEHNLARIFGVNRLTLRSALSILDNDGIIERRPRSGTYIKNVPVIKDKANKQDDKVSLVTIMMRTSGHIYAEQFELICRNLQYCKKIPLVVPLPPDYNYLPLLTHIHKNIEMGSREIVLTMHEDLWLEPLASRMGFLKEQKNCWDRVVWISPMRPPEHIIGGFIGVNIKEGVNKVVKYLKEHGNRKITYLTHYIRPDQPYIEYHSSTAYKEAMRENGLEEYINIVYQSEIQEENVEIAKALLRSKNRPDAVFASADFRLISVYKAANESGIRIPEDIELVGIGDTPWAREYLLTSLSPEIEKIASGIIKILQYPKDRNIDDIAIHISPRLIIRESTRGSNSLDRNTSEYHDSSWAANINSGYTKKPI